MIYARIASVEYKPGSADRALRLAKAELMPLLRKPAGFVSYAVYRVGENRIASIACYDNKASAEQSAQIAADWLKAKVGSDISSSQVSVGELVFDSGEAGAAPTLEQRPMAH